MSTTHRNLVRSSTDSLQRSININLNLHHTTVNKNKKKPEEPKKDKEDEKTEAQIVNQMTSFIKSLMLGSQLNKETLAEIQLPSVSKLKEATGPQKLQILTRVCVDLRN